MTLTAGSSFGGYEIAESIGAGGMGEVYRATDTMLERDVAIKVLPESFAAEPERVSRFEQEAKLLAALNHTNIAQIYGLEKSDGGHALVMELVEGPTLADRIEQGPLPVDEALRVAMQLTAALEAAHAQGIVHRDLKPANIKLRPDGAVKVLDFGIAIALEDPSARKGPQSPSLTTPAMTESGMILGTASYMAPEQARGRPVDQRADVWAFGCVLYEMLTGQQAFGGEDVTTTLARVLERGADMEALPATVSPSIRRTIELCLAKDVKDRLHAIGDVRLALGGAFDIEAPAAAAVAAPRPLWRRALPVVSAVLLTTLVIGFAEEWISEEPEPVRESRQVTRFIDALAENLPLENAGRAALAISPDGRQFAYVGPSGLYVRSMNELEPQLLLETSGVQINSPFFSPDAEAIAYWDQATNQLMRLPRRGGATGIIAGGVGRPFGTSWNADGSIYFAQLDGIYRVPADGGALPEVVIATEGDDQAYGPQLLPDGDSLLFSIATRGDWDNGDIVVQSLSTGERHTLVMGGTSMRYLPTGHLIYAYGEQLFGVAFDLGTLSVLGNAVPLVDGVMRESQVWQSGVAHYDVSANGTLIYARLELAGSRIPVWVDRTGREMPVDFEPGLYGLPRVSPDGTRLAFNDAGEGNPIWIWDIAADTRTRLALGPNGGDWPVWTPDGLRIAYHPGAGQLIDWQAANNIGGPSRVTTGASPESGAFHPEGFSPSGAELLFYGRGGSGTGIDIGLVSVGAGADPVWLLQGPSNEAASDISPDGRWIVYQSDESGRDEVYVRPFPNVDEDRRQVSNAGGSQPLWSPDGRELFYVEPGTPPRLMTVSVEPGSASFEFTDRSALMDWPYVGSRLGRNYDVTVDGTRFIAIRDLSEESTDPGIIVVENWFEEVEQRVPTFESE